MKKILALAIALVLVFSATAMAATVIDTFDKLGNWETSVEAKLDKSDVKQGTGAMQMELPEGEGIVQAQYVMSEPIDLSAYADNGEVKFWFYVDDASKLNGASGGQFELCNGGKPDTAEHTFDISAYPFVNGWNEVTLKIADANSKGADLSKIDFVRFYRFATGPVTVKFDGMAVVNPGETVEWPAAPSTPATSDAGIMIFAVVAVVFAAAGVAVVLKKRQEA